MDWWFGFATQKFSTIPWKVQQFLSRFVTKMRKFKEGDKQSKLEFDWQSELLQIVWQLLVNKCHQIEKNYQIRRSLQRSDRCTQEPPGKIRALWSENMLKHPLMIIGLNSSRFLNFRGAFCQSWEGVCKKNIRADAEFGLVFIWGNCLRLAYPHICSPLGPGTKVYKKAVTLGPWFA